jgi:hydrogenase maturation protease
MIAGVGNPWLGDLDFGPQFLRRYLEAGWPEEVVIEDASLAAHRVLHQLQETEPDRVVFVTAYPRGGEPGTVRRYPLDHSEPLPDEEEIADRLGEAAGGVIDFDHTLIVTRYYDALPTDTIVIEVEAVDQTFGTTFSPSVEASFERVLEMVKEEVSRPW